LIHHDGEVAPFARDRQIGDVSHPNLIGSRGLVLPKSIGILLVELVQARVRPVDPCNPSLDAGLTHQPLYTPSAYGYALPLQRSIDSRAPIGFAARHKYRVDGIE
jgi:hypothetical protein